MNSLQKLLDFCSRLEAAHIYFTLARCRDEAVMVRVDVPGERWEIEFFADCRVEVEVFKNSGSDLKDEESLECLFAIHTD